MGDRRDRAVGGRRGPGHKSACEVEHTTEAVIRQPARAHMGFSWLSCMDTVVSDQWSRAFLCMYVCMSVHKQYIVHCARQ